MVFERYDSKTLQTTERKVCIPLRIPKNPKEQNNEYMQRHETNQEIDRYTLEEVLVAAGAPQEGILKECIAVTDYDFPDTQRIATQPAHIDALMVFICTEGEATINYNLEDYTITRGSLLVCSPHNILQISAQSRFKGHALIVSTNLISRIHLDIKRLLPMALRQKQRSGIVIGDTDINAIKAYISLISTELKHAEGAFKRDIIGELVSAAVYKLADIMEHHLCTLPKEESRVNSRAEEYFRQFLETLGENYKEQRSVAFYAKQLCITPKYLTTLIKRISGRSVSEWIDTFVIIEAKTMLRYSTLSVQEIAYHLNFTNQSFFGSYFKRITGLSPSQYKAQE